MKKNLYLSFEKAQFWADFSFVDFPESYLDSMNKPISEALHNMEELENGAIANPDENRMVGHYWLRNPTLAPSKELTESILETLSKLKEISEQVHNGTLQSPHGPFTDLLVVGIGGSALGPQFVGKALGHPQKDKLNVHFFDNTDPDGIDLTLSELDSSLQTTLVLVISKSGGTPETRNGMLEAENAFSKSGLNFPKHAIAITGEGSKLHQHSQKNGWLEFLPMWDWVGGRTSETASVGLLPAALQGINIDDLLAGAREMDQLTRNSNYRENPAAMLALAWYHLTDGKGSKDMVILPYKDRLELFAKYLQQLIMESLGKEKDLTGNVVHQGISVYGNKGSTDQHAYVQQLREGVPNFFATFIEVLKHRDGISIFVDDDEMNSGDYLHGFFLGTRDALYEKNRKSITLTIREITPSAIGGLIALFERAVGLYASLVGINAYHQPGVEAGKKAASSVLNVRKSVVKILTKNKGKEMTASQIAGEIGKTEKEVWVFKILESLTVNQPEKFERKNGNNQLDDLFSFR
ncbi:MAG: glucose-6-phosphate isomerase [Opitutae bacterium]|jgi:glucose-6-phosphate isomerase|nr:glucose-6-phosphate isomerase [Opitutae bacterium]